MASAKIKKGRQRSSSVRQGQGPHRHRPSGHAERRQGALVEGVNVSTRHRKPTQANPQGGIDRREAPMAICKVGLADPKDGKATRVRFETKDGKKVRVAVKSGESIDGWTSTSRACAPSTTTKSSRR